MTNEEQNQPLQQHNVSGCPGDSELIEQLRKKVEREIHEKEQRLIDCAEEYRQMCSYQIAQLRAVQMLYDVMAAGHTHNQKKIFSEVAKETLSREISNLMERYNSSKWRFSDKQSDLPF